MLIFGFNQKYYKHKHHIHLHSGNVDWKRALDNSTEAILEETDKELKYFFFPEHHS